MNRKRKPTRRDLLIVIGRLQDLIGDIVVVFHDRNPNREAQTNARIRRALALCIEVRSYDPPTDGRSPWSVDDHPQPLE